MMSPRRPPSALRSALAPSAEDVHACQRTMRPPRARRSDELGGFLRRPEQAARSTTSIPGRRKWLATTTSGRGRDRPGRAPAIRIFRLRDRRPRSEGLDRAARLFDAQVAAGSRRGRRLRSPLIVASWPVDACSGAKLISSTPSSPSWRARPRPPAATGSLLARFSGCGQGVEPRSFLLASSRSAFRPGELSRAASSQHQAVLSTASDCENVVEVGRTITVHPATDGVGRCRCAAGCRSLDAQLLAGPVRWPSPAPSCSTSLDVLERAFAARS